MNSELEGEFKKKSSHYDIVDSRGRKYRVDFSSLKEYSLDESGQAYGNGIDVRRYDRTKGEVHFSSLIHRKVERTKHYL